MNYKIVLVLFVCFLLLFGCAKSPKDKLRDANMSDFANYLPSSIAASITEAIDYDSFNVTVPDVSVPDINVSTPKVSVPDYDLNSDSFNINIPAVEVPDIQVPDIQVPDIQVPQIQ